MTTLFESGRTLGHAMVRIPALAALPSGSLMAFAEGRSSPGDNGDIDLIARRSPDCGGRWEPPRTVYAEPGPITIGNPAPIVAPETGELLLFCTRDNHDLLLMRSTDDGISFGPPQDLTQLLEDFRGRFPWLRVASGPGHGTVLPDGTLAVPLWFNDKPIEQVHEAAFRVAVLLSHDGGASWQLSEPVPPTIPVLNESMIQTTTDGRVTLNMRCQFVGYRATATSIDGGRSWSEPTLMAALPCCTCQAATLTVTAADGRRALLFANPANGGPHTRATRPARRALTVRLSWDDGATWPYAWEVTSGPSAYCDLAQTNDGRLQLLYETGTSRANEQLALISFDLASYLDQLATRR